MKYHYLSFHTAHRVKRRRRPRLLAFGGKTCLSLVAIRFLMKALLGDVWTRDIGQMGSLAGAAYLLQSNAGVLRHAP